MNNSVFPPFPGTFDTPSLVLPGADIEAFTITIQPFQIVPFTFTPDGKVFYFATGPDFAPNKPQIVDINISAFGEPAPTPAPVPEPSSLLLLGTGLLGVGGAIRRKLLC